METSLHEDGYRERLLSAFHLAFGEFIRQFGQTESTLSFHLEQFVLSLIGEQDLHKEVARALLGSRRTPEIANATKLCLKAATGAGSEHTDADLKEVDDLFSQVAEIRFLRDRTAHYALHPSWKRGEPVYFRTLTRYTVNDLEKTEEILFRIEHLEAATADLRTICARMPFALRLHRPASWEPDAPNAEPRPPWLYKPSELVRTRYREPQSPQ